MSYSFHFLCYFSAYSCSVKTKLLPSSSRVSILNRLSVRVFWGYFVFYFFTQNDTKYDKERLKFHSQVCLVVCVCDSCSGLQSGLCAKINGPGVRPKILLQRKAGS